MKLPKKPVDGYVLRWWTVSCRGEYVTEHTATYHARTRWKDYDPEREHGADLVDDWMLADNGHDTGRVCGWDRMPTYLEAVHSFATRVEAMREAVAQLERWQARLELDLDNCGTYLAHWREQIRAAGE